MKPPTIAALSGILLLTGGTVFCESEVVAASQAKASSDTSKRENEMTENRIKVSIGEKTFAVTLADNPAASAFKALLPLQLKMSDLNGNEKFFHLSSRLPSSDTNPGSIQSGDLLLWSSKSVVLFYKTFPTAYSYTKLGRIDNPQGLAAAVGVGDVTIKFELE